MERLDENVSEYIKDYPKLKFRIAYTYDENSPDVICFAAQPYEFILLDEEAYEPSTFLIYGKLNFDLKLHVGFKGYSFAMTEDLHRRIGKVYVVIEEEFLKRYNS